VPGRCLIYGATIRRDSGFRSDAEKTFYDEEFHMSFEDIRDAIMTMGTDDQKRLIMEVVPQLWDGASNDASLALKLKELVDRDISRLYDETFTL
jgi:hypothetical protein